MGRVDRVVQYEEIVTAILFVSMLVCPAIV